MRVPAAALGLVWVQVSTSRRETPRGRCGLTPGAPGDAAVSFPGDPRDAGTPQVSIGQGRGGVGAPRKPSWSHWERWEPGMPSLRAEPRSCNNEPTFQESRSGPAVPGRLPCPAPSLRRRHKSSGRPTRGAPVSAALAPKDGRTDPGGPGCPRDAGHPPRDVSATSQPCSREPSRECLTADASHSIVTGAVGR